MTHAVRPQDRRIGALGGSRPGDSRAAGRGPRALADEWPDSVARAVAEGVAEFDADGTLRLVGRQRSAETT